MSHELIVRRGKAATKTARRQASAENSCSDEEEWQDKPMGKTAVDLLCTVAEGVNSISIRRCLSAICFQGARTQGEQQPDAGGDTDSDDEEYRRKRVKHALRQSSADLLLNLVEGSIISIMNLECMRLRTEPFCWMQALSKKARSQISPHDAAVFSAFNSYRHVTDTLAQISLLASMTL